MQTQQSVQGLKQLSHELVAELLRLKEYGCSLPRSIFVYGATREVTAMVTEAIKHELVDERGIKASVRSEYLPPSVREGDYCIDIGYFFSAHRRTPPLLKPSSDEVTPPMASPDVLEALARQAWTIDKLRRRTPQG